MKNTIIGVIGGMGPQASAEFYLMLIDKAQHCYGARNNDDYPEIVIDSVPVPYFISDTTHMEEAAKMLEDRIRRISVFGATSIAMTCNTGHLLFPRLQRQTSVPMVSMIDEVVKKIEKQRKAVLLLATPTTLRTQLYQIALQRVHIHFVIPKDEDFGLLESLIRRVLVGYKKKELTGELVALVEQYVKQGNISSIVLGCTELPLIFPEQYRLPVYSSLSILAEALLKRYYRERRSL